MIAKEEFIKRIKFHAAVLRGHKVIERPFRKLEIRGVTSKERKGFHGGW